MLILSCVISPSVLSAASFTNPRGKRKKQNKRERERGTEERREREKKEAEKEYEREGGREGGKMDQPCSCNPAAMA